MRLFIALILPDEALDALTRVQSTLGEGRAVPEEALHLTLAFLGDQPEDIAHALHDELAGLVAPLVTLRLAGPVVFGGKGGQAIGLEADRNAALLDLQGKVQSRMRAAGIIAERRRFRPHVTVTRLPGRRDPGRLVEALRLVRLGPFDCTAFGLFSSVLRPDGAEYEALANYSLR